MNEFEVVVHSSPDLESPVLIEGLPGVGLVGKLAVDHLIEELDGEVVRTLYSEHLPPGVAVGDDGTAELASISLYAITEPGRDLLILAGDSQAQEARGQYRIASKMLSLAMEFDLEEVITLGGFGTGEQVEDYAVVGGVIDESDDLKARLEDAGVQVGDDNAPDTIVGMSGLLIGLGGLEGLEAAGLLGITPGYYVDPASARAVLEVLQEALEFSVSLETLDEQAEQVQQFLEQLQAQSQQEQPGQSGENLRYFG